MWTYSPGYISNSGTTAALMKVRFLTGDTNTQNQQLQDEEIYAVFTYETSPSYAAAICADALGAKYSFMVDTQNGSMRVGAEKRAKHYFDLAERLRRGGPGDLIGDPDLTLADMYVGGSSISKKQALAADSDTVQPSFRIGQDDNPAASSGTGNFSIL